MNTIPFYDATRTYDDNYENGPFGIFADQTFVPPNPKNTATFMGFTVSIPFGIPAGPLLTSKFISGAWRCGFAIATYKTVRSDIYPCHPFPNVIKVKGSGSDIHPGDTVIGDLDMSSIDIEHDGITNSFAVPSKIPTVWQQDISDAVTAMKPGNVVIASFMGIKRDEMTLSDYVNDFVKACLLVKETGAPIMEVNFSCPNFGKEGLICNDIETSTLILEGLHQAKGNVPLLVKIGYFVPEAQETFEKLLDAIQMYADGVEAINTIPAKVVDTDGKQLLPGSPVRLSSGTCGATIRWGGLEMAERIMEYKKRKDLKDFSVVGVGGVVKPEDYFTYKKLGVDAVMSATGAMWRPTLALEIIEQLNAS